MALKEAMGKQAQERPKGKKLRISGSDGEETSTIMWACIIEAQKQNKELQMILNLGSNKLHIRDRAKKAPCTKGCVWNYNAEKVWTINDLKDLDKLPAIRCELCFPEIWATESNIALAASKGDSTEVSKTHISQVDDH